MLQVIPASADQLAALAEGDDVFATRFGVAVAIDYCEFAGAAQASLEALWNGDAQPAWWTHLFVLPEQNALIGLGGYKGAPDASGAVEIGYAIAPAWRGRGLATSAARALVERAFADPSVRCVVAHTLAQRNASTRVLERCGLRRTRELVDPDDGQLWRWELERDAGAST